MLEIIVGVAGSKLLEGSVYLVVFVGDYLSLFMEDRLETRLLCFGEASVILAI